MAALADSLPAFMNAAFWNDRYSVVNQIYGEASNVFVAEMASQIPNGPVLCLAEGEGRNAVRLAALDHQVTAGDQSEVGMTKVCRLAEIRGAEIETIVTGLVIIRWRTEI